MQEPFSSAKLKAIRANRHIDDLQRIIEDFAASDCYAISIGKNVSSEKNCMTVNPAIPFPEQEAALIIGDALHNLRSALDILWYETVRLTHGIPNQNTSFPIRECKEQFETTIQCSLILLQVSFWMLLSQHFMKFPKKSLA
jgi:hypothetical protein